MPAHEPPMLDAEPSGAPAPDAPSEPAAVEAAPRFAPRTPEELARAAIVRELRELEKLSPPFDRAQQNADWNWLFSELSKGPLGALAAHAGYYVVVYRQQVVGHHDCPLQARLDACKSSNPRVNPDQFVVFYVDVWDNVEG